MTERHQRQLSRLLSLALRHKPERLHLTLDDAGWVSVAELLDALARTGKPTTEAELQRLVAESDKQRFALSEDGARIRANQGHTVSVSLGYVVTPPPARLFHGTVARFLPSIRRDGLVRGERHHVHLSATPDVAEQVGRRRGRAVLLMVRAAEMAAAGHDFFVSNNGVWLTDHVPPQYLDPAEATTLR